MGRYLVMYDLSGIQGFIFQTNRLKEIAGASYLVSKALFSNVPELAQEEPKDWMMRGRDGFAGLDASEARTVYVGGGNALVLFGSENAAHDFTRQLKRRVFEQTGGMLRICSAGVSVEENSRLFDLIDPANPNRLRAKLDRSKAKSPLALTARGFSINRLDNECFEPVIYFEDAISDRGSKLHFLPRSRRLKLEEYLLQHHAGSSSEYRSPLLELHENRSFEVEFEGFFKNGNPGRAGKRFLAVVHIDGNTMGQRIARFLKACSKRDQSFEEDLVDMRDMSVCVGGSYKEALGQMIDSVYEGQEGALPFRPIVADGDDITFICRSEKAFECVEVFVDALQHPKTPAASKEGLPEPTEFSVGAGIAFVKPSYPFSSAYEMAEELCKNAKKAALERAGSGAIAYDGVWDDVFQPPISSVDFHICSGEVIGDIAGFRRRYLVQPGEAGEVRLCMRPYHIGITLPEEESSEADFTLEGFRKLIGELQEGSDGDNPWIARGKLKGLRDKYGEGAERAEEFGRTIVERDVAMRKSGAKGGDASERFIMRFESLYSTVADGSGERPCRYARFFDALDVLDLCEGIKEREVIDERVEGDQR